MDHVESLVSGVINKEEILILFPSGEVEKKNELLVIDVSIPLFFRLPSTRDYLEL